MSNFISPAAAAEEEDEEWLASQGGIRIAYIHTRLYVTHLLSLAGVDLEEKVKWE